MFSGANRPFSARVGLRPSRCSLAGSDSQRLEMAVVQLGVAPDLGLAVEPERPDQVKELGHLEDRLLAQLAHEVALLDRGVGDQGLLEGGARLVQGLAGPDVAHGLAVLREGIGAGIGEGRDRVGAHGGNPLRWRSCPQDIPAKGPAATFWEAGHCPDTGPTG